MNPPSIKKLKRIKFIDFKSYKRLYDLKSIQKICYVCGQNKWTTNDIFMFAFKAQFNSMKNVDTYIVKPNYDSLVKKHTYRLETAIPNRIINGLPIKLVNGSIESLKIDDPIRVVSEKGFYNSIVRNNIKRGPYLFYIGIKAMCLNCENYIYYLENYEQKFS